MTDDLERDLRDLLHRRADSIAAHDVRTWSAPDPAPRRRRSYGPVMAAAAAVVLVAAVLTAVIHGRTGNTGAGGGAEGGMDKATTDRFRPVPAGQKVVSTLGLELFVPKAWTTDGCAPMVRTPLTEERLGGNCSPGTATGHVPLLTIGLSVIDRPACQRSLGRVLSGTEPLCAQLTNGLAEYYFLFGTEPVEVSLSGVSEPLALTVLRSAHLADPDRNGCSVRIGSSSTSTTSAHSPARVCVYGPVFRGSEPQADSLLASAALTGRAGARLLEQLRTAPTGQPIPMKCPLQPVDTLSSWTVVITAGDNPVLDALVRFDRCQQGAQIGPASAHRYLPTTLARFLDSYVPTP